MPRTPGSQRSSASSPSVERAVDIALVAAHREGLALERASAAAPPASPSVSASATACSPRRASPRRARSRSSARPTMRSVEPLCPSSSGSSSASSVAGLVVRVELESATPRRSRMSRASRRPGQLERLGVEVDDLLVAQPRRRPRQPRGGTGSRASASPASRQWYARIEASVSAALADRGLDVPSDGPRAAPRARPRDVEYATSRISMCLNVNCESPDELALRLAADEVARLELRSSASSTSLHAASASTARRARTSSRPPPRRGVRAAPAGSASMRAAIASRPSPAARRPSTPLRDRRRELLEEERIAARDVDEALEVVPSVADSTMCAAASSRASSARSGSSTIVVCAGSPLAPRGLRVEELGPRAATSIDAASRARACEVLEQLDLARRAQWMSSNTSTVGCSSPRHSMMRRAA